MPGAFDTETRTWDAQADPLAVVPAALAGDVLLGPAAEDAVLRPLLDVLAAELGDAAAAARLPALLVRAAEDGPQAVDRVGLDALAYTLSVDLADAQAPDAVVRSLVLNAPGLHALRGTAAGLRAVLTALGLPATHEQTGGPSALFSYPFRRGREGEVGVPAQVPDDAVFEPESGRYGLGSLVFEPTYAQTVTLPGDLPRDLGSLSFWFSFADYVDAAGPCPLVALGETHLLTWNPADGRLTWNDGAQDVTPAGSFGTNAAVHVTLTWDAAQATRTLRVYAVDSLDAPTEASDVYDPDVQPVVGPVYFGPQVDGPNDFLSLRIEGVFVWETALTAQHADDLAESPVAVRPYPAAEVLEPAEIARRAALRGLLHVDGVPLVDGSGYVGLYELATALPALRSWAEYVVAVDLDVAGEAYGAQVRRALDYAGPVARHAVVVGRFTEPTSQAEAEQRRADFAAALGPAYEPPRFLPVFDGLFVDGSVRLVAVGVFARPLPPFVRPRKPRGRVFFPQPVTAATRPVRVPPDVKTSPLPVYEPAPVVVVGPPGPPGPPGDAVELEPFYFVQNTPAAVWIINHNLNRAGPPVVVVDSSQREVEGSLSYPDDDTVVVTFAAPFAGVAYVYP